MRARLSSEQRQFLEDFVREVDSDPERLPQPLRAREEAGRDLAALLLHADESGATDEDQAELDVLMRAATRWEKGLLELPQGLVFELTEDNLADWRDSGGPGQIWIRWDAVSAEQRATVVSYATALRDAHLGQPRGGRPRGAHLTDKELAALSVLSEPVDEVTPIRGWRHMIDAGAWEHDGRADTDPKAQHARSARWRRLQARARSESAHE